MEIERVGSSRFHTQPTSRGPLCFFKILGFYQDPTTYTPYGTTLTPLGNVNYISNICHTSLTTRGQQQEFQLGQLLRARYLNASSSFFIPGMDTTLANQTEISIRADAGGEPGVIYNSAVALLQGLFPPTTAYNTTLSNGTTVTGPLGGYQTIPSKLFRNFHFGNILMYAPVTTVDGNNDVSLEGWLDCNVSCLN